MAHVCNPSTWEMEEEIILGYIVSLGYMRLCLNKQANQGLR